MSSGTSGKASKLLISRAWCCSRKERIRTLRPDPSPSQPAADVLADTLAMRAPLPDIPTIPSRVPIAMAATPGTRDADVAAALASAIAALRSR